MLTKHIARWKMEWLQKGRAEGRAEGIIEGELKSLHVILKILLEKRLGPLSQELLAAIDQNSDKSILFNAVVSINDSNASQICLELLGAGGAATANPAHGNA